MIGSNRNGQRSDVRGQMLGFTLVEVLVALAVFSVVMTVATNLFLTYQRVNRKSESLVELTASARFIVERIAREVREGTIDYSAYTNLSVLPQSTLYLRNSANAPVSFVHNGNTIILNGEELTGANVHVQDVQFTVAPVQDPFEFNEAAGQFLADEQPRVTIFLSLDNNKPENDRDYVKYDVQTTISSRVYRR